jgi:invasion protein IalB
MSSSCAFSVGGRSVGALLIALCASIAATAACGQQVIPFGDVPATPDFTEQEIAARGQQYARNLTYSDWSKMCFRGAQGADTKMVCRTTITGRWDTGQIALKVDLIEREDAPAQRLQIWVLPGFFLQPGIKLTVDSGSSMQVPYSICFANACVAATVAEPGFVGGMESGRTLSLDAVNTNVMTVIASLPLDTFVKAHQGAPARVFEQRLEGKWEQPTEEGRAKQ